MADDNITRDAANIPPMPDDVANETLAHAGEQNVSDLGDAVSRRIDELNREGKLGQPGAGGPSGGVGGALGQAGQTSNPDGGDQ